MSVSSSEALPQIVRLSEAFGAITSHFAPAVVATVNETAIRLTKVKGEFIWHHHADEDELFLVVKGTLTIRFPEGDVTVREGELIVVPRGVEHLPVAEEEAHVLLVELMSTTKGGNVGS